MKKDQATVTLADISKQMSAALRRTTVRPSIYGYKAQPYQEEFHKCDTKIRMLLGGNRSGKTVAGGAEAVMWLSGTSVHSQIFPTPIRGRCVGTDFENGINRIILPEIARWIPPSLLVNGSWEDSYSKGDRTLHLENGSQCEFLSNDQEVSKHAGTSRHFVWFDEEPDEAIYNENLARLVDTKGRAWVTVTPLQELSWMFDRLYEKSKTDKSITVFKVSTSENAYVNEGELTLLTDGLSEAEREARLHGDFISQKGTIYKSVLNPSLFIPSVVDSDSWSGIYSNWGFIGCMDHGYTNPTAFYILAFDKEDRIIVIDEYYEKGRVVEENAVAILSRINQLKLSEKLLYIVADPSIRNKDPITGTSIQAEYAEYGLYLGLANNDVHAGINRVMNRFRRKKLFVCRNCDNLIWELPRYRWAKFYSRKIGDRSNQKEEPMKKDDHGCDAIRYGLMSRPALADEQEHKVGNIIGAPVAINANNRVDDEFVNYLGRRPEMVPSDPTLGSEW